MTDAGYKTAMVAQVAKEIHVRLDPKLRAAAQQPMTDTDQLALVKANLVALFDLADIVEESDSGTPFHPNRLGCSCRATDGAEMNRLLGELKAFAAS